MAKTKKNLAIVIGATGNMSFAAANVVMSVKNTSGNIVDEIIILHSDIKEKDQELMKSIFNCRFIDYKFPEVDSDTFKNTHFYRYSMLAYSRYEIFNWLEEFKNIIWLDIDILVKRNLQELLDHVDGDMGMFEEKHTFGGLFLKLDDRFDNDRKFFNTGVILYRDTLPNYQILTNWCYQKTRDLAENLSLPDQAVINLMFQTFPEIKIRPIDRRFNCHPSDKNVKNAAIIHAYDSDKFWNYYYNFKEWNKSYKQWLKMGGSPFVGVKAHIIYVWIKKYFPMAPNPFRQTGKFFVYMLKLLIGKEKRERWY